MVAGPAMSFPEGWPPLSLDQGLPGDCQAMIPGQDQGGSAWGGPIPPQEVQCEVGLQQGQQEQVVDAVGQVFPLRGGV